MSLPEILPQLAADSPLDGLNRIPPFGLETGSIPLAYRKSLPESDRSQAMNRPCESSRID